MGICFFLYKSTYDPVKNINRNWISSHKWVESTSSNSSPYGFSNLLKPTIKLVTKWVETLRPKLGFFTIYKLQNPSMQCCADVRATYRKQPTPQLWKEGTGEGQRFFCSLKLPYLSTMSQQFWRRLQLTGVCKRREREDKLITTCLFQSIVTSLGSSFSESNSNNLVFPRTWGIEW